MNETLTTGPEPRRRDFTIWSVGLTAKIITTTRGSLRPTMILLEPAGLYVPFTHGASRERMKKREEMEAQPVAKMTGCDMDTCFTESAKSPLDDKVKKKDQSADVVLPRGVRERGRLSISY